MPRGFQEVKATRLRDNGPEWWYGCQPYAPAAFYPQEILLVLLSVRDLVDPETIVQREGLFIHLIVCLRTGPKPLPKPALHIVRSRASSFKCEYPLLSLRSSSSFLCFLPRLPVTSISKASSPHSAI